MFSLKESVRVHVWVPELHASKGGIQVFSQFFIRAVSDCLPEAQVVVLSKHDNSFPDLPRRRVPMQFRCAGWWAARLRTAAFVGQLVKCGLRERPDLILSTHVNFTPVASWLKRLAGIRYTAVAHGVDVWGLPPGAVRKALRGADRVLAVSHFTRGRMIAELGLNAARVGVMSNTVDTDRFTPAAKPHYLLKRFQLRPDQPVVLTVARLASAERYKGYDQILRALPAIRRAVPDVHYILGGRGPDRPRVETLIRELGLADCVTLAGYIPDHELCDFYNLCDVFAMPSRGEGFGIVYLEAMACGKPVLAGNKDGSVDALLGGELGVLVDPDDVAEIARQLTLVLQGQHPLPILRQPHELRLRSGESYGYQRFVEQLHGHLADLGLRAEQPYARQ